MGRNSVMILLVGLAMGLTVGVSGNQLAYDYYKYSCPDLESIVKAQMLLFISEDVTAPAAFLRLMFHDCQVQGCDASILLDLDHSEMESSQNFGFRKLQEIQRIKSALEVVCPGQNDSRTSSNKQADIHLPSPMITVDELLHIFVAKGMSIEESVAILGAHTLGSGHCINIVSRLYDPPADIDMDGAFEAMLKLQCPTRVPVTNLTFVTNDLTPGILDHNYYSNALMGRGLFGIDYRVSRDPRTEPIGRLFAANQSEFFHVFSSAFRKLSSTNVLTGSKGEVRIHCSKVN